MRHAQNELHRLFIAQYDTWLWAARGAVVNYVAELFLCGVGIFNTLATCPGPFCPKSAGISCSPE